MVRVVEGTLRKAAKKANTLLLTIPAKLVLDGKFPFKEGEKVRIEIKVVDEFPGLFVTKKEN